MGNQWACQHTPTYPRTRTCHNYSHNMHVPPGCSQAFLAAVDALAAVGAAVEIAGRKYQTALRQLQNRQPGQLAS